MRQLSSETCVLLWRYVCHSSDADICPSWNYATSCFAPRVLQGCVVEGDNSVLKNLLCWGITPEIDSDQFPDSELCTGGVSNPFADKITSTLPCLVIHLTGDFLKNFIFNLIWLWCMWICLGWTEMKTCVCVCMYARLCVCMLSSVMVYLYMTSKMRITVRCTVLESEKCYGFVCAMGLHTTETKWMNDPIFKYRMRTHESLDQSSLMLNRSFNASRNLSTAGNF